MSTLIPMDIQVQIIERLPVKSLIQFRSVCKAWKSFIDSAEFIAGYSVPHTQPQHLMIRYKYGEENEVKYVSYVDDDDTFRHQNFAPIVPPLVQLTTRIVDSSHGLLCLTGYFGEPDDSCNIKKAVLWNPAIRKSIAVTVPNVVHQPFISVLGFGVCPYTKDPKLVKITYNDDFNWKMESISCIPCQVMVFTLSSGEWTCLSSNLPRKSIKFLGFQTVIDQFIYWVAYDWINVDGGSRKLIMSFDLSTYEFREVDLPDSLCGSYSSISRLRESLVLLEYNRRFPTDKQVCDVWMMEHGDRKAFTKLFTIKAPDASVVWTLGFRKSGEPIIEMQDNLVIDLTAALVVYEPCLEQIKGLGICGNVHSFSLNSYTESLLLLDHDDGCIVRCGAVKR